MAAIHEEQNQESFLRLGRAFGRRYEIAGRVRAFRVGVAFVFLASGPLAALLAPALSTPIAAAAGAWAALGALILQGWETSERWKAARAQEWFDCDLFRFGWNEGVAGIRPAEEDITDWGRRYSSESHADWYPDVSGAVFPLDVLLCQRASVVWGRRNHEIYAPIVAVSAAAWIVIEVGLAIALNLTFTTALIKLFLPSLPALLLAGDVYKAHKAQAKGKHAVEILVERIWREAVDSGTAPDGSHCRQVQDRVFQLRQGPRVPTVVYRWRRGRDEAAMREAVRGRIDGLPGALRT